MTSIEQLIAVADGQQEGTDRITYWSLRGAVTLEGLERTFKDASLPEDWLPRPTPALSALRTACEKVKRADQLVRRLPDKRQGFAVVTEFTQPSSDQPLDYTVDFTAEVEMVGQAPYLEGAFPEELQAHFRQALGELNAGRIGDWLAASVLHRLDGVSLRPGGGVYFVPRAAAERWDQVSRAVQAASGHEVYSIPCMRSDEAVRAVSTGLREEATGALDALAQEMEQMEELGKRALHTRIKRCEEVAARAARYEQHLEMSLTEIRDQATTLKRAFTAGLLALESTEEKR